jgi:hypothetical protein
MIRLRNGGREYRGFMNRKTILGLFASGFLFVCLFGCDKNSGGSTTNFKPNKAELGEDWTQFRHDASFNVWVFPDNEPRPQEHRTPKGARLFWNGDVTAEELNLIDDGLTEMLSTCMRDSSESSPPDIWKQYAYFLSVSDYKVIFVTSNYTLQEGEAAGCAGMITGPHGVYTAAGTVGGLNDRVGSSTPGSKGGVYILIPKQSAEQLARTECKSLMKTAVRNEGEHVFFSQDPARYFLHANDGVGGNHPYCVGM